MAKDGNNGLNTIRLSNGCYTENGNETLTEMMRIHFPGSTVTNCSSFAPLPSTSRCDRKSWEVACNIVTKDRVVWALESFDPYKSPGPDGVIPILLQKGKDIIVPILCKIYRACLAYGYIPSAWRQTKVIFIPKPGKETYLDAKSFRPICLMSFLLKALEKLIDRHIREGVLISKPLSISQHAYQSGRSTNTALYELAFTLEKSLKFRETALAVFLDIEGAFDRVPIKSIMRALDERGTEKVITRWISFMLNDRLIHASLLGDSICVRAQVGCPQGGVLSPLLWCLVVDGLLNDIRAYGAQCIGYADDVAIIVKGKYESTLVGILNDILRKVEQWCKHEGLSVNPDKTSFVAFTKKKVLKLTEVELYGHSLKRVNEVKYLGVYFDVNLTWKRHMDYCISRAKRIFWSCRNAIGKTWGLNPRLVRWVYNMIICPIITYGSIAWWSRVRNDVAKSELAKIQRMVCMAMTGALRTTPTAAMELLLDMYPLHMHIEAEAIICANRLRRQGLWYRYSEYLSWGNLNHLIWSHPTLAMKSDSIPCVYSFDKPFKVSLHNRTDWKDSPNTFLGMGITWFTDGSKMDSGTGAGVYCLEDGTSWYSPLGKFTTVFQAEVYAILMCSIFCLNREYKDVSINICSDSQAALLALNRHFFTSGIVWECFNALCRLARLGKNQVHLHWVPGHTGIVGNEMADVLARKGSDAPFWGPEPALGVSGDCIRGVVFSNLRMLQYQDWLALKGQRQAKELNSGCPSARAKELLGLSRNSIRKVIGLLTGHCGLKRHLNIMGVIKDPICRGCHHDEETASHVLCNCEVYAAHRFEHLGRHLIEPWELQNIPVRCLLNFVSAAGLFKD